MHFVFVGLELALRRCVLRVQCIFTVRVLRLFSVYSPPICC